MHNSSSHTFENQTLLKIYCQDGYENDVSQTESRLGVASVLDNKYIMVRWLSHCSYIKVHGAHCCPGYIPVMKHLTIRLTEAPAGYVWKGKTTEPTIV